MNFDNKMPEWKNEGTEPSADLKTNGFQGGYKPPAGVFNYMWALICKAITEIQNALSKVDNTADSEKSVKYASEAGTGRKVKYPLTVRFNGGNEEGTDLWTYDGSTSRSVNITPAKIGARPTDEPNIVVNAVREETDDGKEIYVVTDSRITELYNGLEITIIPNERNATTSPRLKINDFEDKGIRLALSFNCAATTTVKENYFQNDRPITLKYHSALSLGIQGQGAWLFADRIKTSAQDLYGSVPISSGGTGGETAETARESLGVAPAFEDEDYAGCYYRTENGEKLWINPPMLNGVEYKTTEKFNGQNVYVFLKKWEMWVGTTYEGYSWHGLGTVGTDETCEFVSLTGMYAERDYTHEEFGKIWKSINDADVNMYAAQKGTAIGVCYSATTKTEAWIECFAIFKYTKAVG